MSNAIIVGERLVRPTDVAQNFDCYSKLKADVLPQRASDADSGWFVLRHTPEGDFTGFPAGTRVDEVFVTSADAATYKLLTALADTKRLALAFCTSAETPANPVYLTYFVPGRTVEMSRTGEGVQLNSLRMGKSFRAQNTTTDKHTFLWGRYFDTADDATVLEKDAKLRVVVDAIFARPATRF